MDRSRVSKSAAMRYISKYNKEISQQLLDYIVDMYLYESLYEGVNFSLLIAQMAHETNFLRFGGEVERSQNNFDSLGTMDNNSTRATFSSIRDGVRAHVQHMKAYASVEKLTRPCVDQRFEIVRRGSVVDIFGFGKFWGLDIDYGSVIKSRIDDIINLSSSQQR